MSYRNGAPWWHVADSCGGFRDVEADVDIAENGVLAKLGGGVLAALDLMGMERVIRDQYEEMLHEIPEEAVRQQKYICTGISLGG